MIMMLLFPHLHKTQLHMSTREQQTSVDTGFRLVSRAHNELDPVIPGTVFISYHGPHLPFGRSFASSAGMRDKSSTSWPLDCDLDSVIRRITNSVETPPHIYRGFLPTPTSSSTILTYTQLQKLIDEPIFDLQPIRVSPTTPPQLQESKPFPERFALELEMRTCLYAFFRDQKKRKLDKKTKANMRFLPKQERPFTDARQFVDANLRDTYEIPMTSDEKNIPQKGIAEAYTDWFNAEVKQSMRPKRVTNPQPQPQPVEEEEGQEEEDDNGWTETEKDIFFDLLGRFGRHRLAEIADYIPTKSLVDVEEYHNLLLEASEKHKSAFQVRVEAGEQFIQEEDQPVSFFDIPAAMEMSDAWMALEESIAKELTKEVNVMGMEDGDPPFRSLSIKDIETDSSDSDEDNSSDENDSSEECNSILKHRNLLKLSSELFYPCPANGMDIQIREYNEELPEFEGIEGDVLKELLVLAVEKTRELVMQAIQVAKQTRMLANGKRMLRQADFANGTWFNTRSRYFALYPERSGAERTLTNEERQGEFSGNLMVDDPRVLLRSDALLLKEVDFSVSPNAHSNTSLFTDTVKFSNARDRKKFLSIAEQKRYDRLLAEQIKYSEELEQGDVGYMEIEIDEEEYEAGKWDTMAIAYLLRDMKQENNDPNFVFPRKTEVVPDVVDYLHREETAALEYHDFQHTWKEEAGLAAYFSTMVPQCYRDREGMILKFARELDNEDRANFNKQHLRYRYDIDGREIPFWTQQVPVVRQDIMAGEIIKTPREEYPVTVADPETGERRLGLVRRRVGLPTFPIYEDSTPQMKKRGPGLGLVQPESETPPTIERSQRSINRHVWSHETYNDGSRIRPNLAVNFTEAHTGSNYEMYVGKNSHTIVDEDQDSWSVAEARDAKTSEGEPFPLIVKRDFPYFKRIRTSSGYVPVGYGEEYEAVVDDDDQEVEPPIKQEDVEYIFEEEAESDSAPEQEEAMVVDEQGLLKLEPVDNLLADNKK